MDSALDHSSVEQVKVQLPADILFGIFQHLPSYDIKSVRQVSKAFNFIGSPYLVRSVYVSGLIQDQEVLKAVSEHPVFAKRVTELVFNISMLDMNVTRDELKAEYGEHVREQLDKNKRFDLELTENELATSYKRYRDYCWEQHTSIRTGSAMACLAAAFPLLPKLQHFRVVTGWKYTYGDQGGPSGRSWDIKVLSLGIIVAQNQAFDDRLYRERERRWIHFLLKIVGTLATTFTEQPSLSLDMKLPGHGVLEELLHMPLEDLGHWQNAFCHLQSLDLRISSDIYHGPSLRALVQSAPRLEILRLYFLFDMPSPLSLIRLLGTFRTNFLDLLRFLLTLTAAVSKSFTWTRLRNFKIVRTFLKVETLLDFLQYHAGSLRHLQFYDITLSNGTWANLLDRLRSWHDESLMQLEECPISYPRNNATSVRRRIEAKEVTSEAIIAFLRGQGENPFSAALDPTAVVPGISTT